LGGYWEFPGGKIEEGEDAETALTRELKEELGMEVQVKKYFGQNIHQYENFQIELVAYECDFVKASFKLTDHDEYKFVEPKELVQIKLAPADMPLTKMLIQN
jgi:8-oxo-dGTP diphosphatase